MPSQIKQTAFRLPDDIASAMLRVKAHDGIPQSEQVRRALRTWLEKRGALKRVPPTGRRAR